MSGVIDLEKLSDMAKAVAGGWFGMMRPSTGKLTFSLVKSKPTPEAQAALDELVQAGVVSVERLNTHGGLIYCPLVDCHAALVWLHKNAKKPVAKIALTEPVLNDEDARRVQLAAMAKAKGAQS